jgi:hypothetical protein
LAGMSFRICFRVITILNSSSRMAMTLVCKTKAQMMF